MRKTAGFLLVLFLATLVVITTSSGDEFTNSHPTHLEADYGPKIQTCGDCHPASNDCVGLDDPYDCCEVGIGIGTDCWKGVFTDAADITFTGVCDTCHSPDGAYDGVDSTSGSVGAKDNWIEGVTTGLDLTPGKEKWCVGCHDDGSSVINGVSAPNIAGDDIFYGYYKTGHGKFGSECLACHDPFVTHVDADARTYDATALPDSNQGYQAGYRLKLVGGQAPLEIPRLADVSADQFLQCFSCHDSTPFMDELNTDTNFRADVTDSCVDLGSPVNRHYEHLIIDTLRYDSDFNGGPADSRPSCPACHNVHGPKVRGGTTNAPAMIRTGELIGWEPALDLDYFTSTCIPDTPPSVSDLSSTNETVGSTAGMMIPGPDGTFGTIARNGVCDMCHNEAQPYWREATTLPVQAANDFSLDGTAVALWSLEQTSGDRYDFIGSNDLTSNTVGYSTDAQEGTNSADFTNANTEYLSIADTSLANGFPLKAAATAGDGTFSITFWYKAESQGSYRALVSKWDDGASQKTFQIRDHNGTLDFIIGYNNGATLERVDNTYTSITTGRWYHIGLTFNNNDKTWKLRVYDDS
jgi:hypothetical protein